MPTIHRMTSLQAGERCFADLQARAICGTRRFLTSVANLLGARVGAREVPTRAKYTEGGGEVPTRAIYIYIGARVR